MRMRVAGYMGEEGRMEEGGCWEEKLGVDVGEGWGLNTGMSVVLSLRLKKQGQMEEAGRIVDVVVVAESELEAETVVVTTVALGPKEVEVKRKIVLKSESEPAVALAADTGCTVF